MPLVNNQEQVEEKAEVTLAQVLNVPKFVEKYLDIDTRLRLRKTCTAIREIVNEKLLNIGYFRYECYKKFIEIATNEGFKVSYGIIEGGLRVTNGDKRKFINAEHEEDQIKIIQRDLMSVLCSEKLRIDTFEIDDWSTVFEKEPPIGMIVLRNTSNQVPNKLKVRNLDFSARSLDEVFIETLKNIEPEHLKFLQLSCSSVWKDLYNLEQWRRLKTLNLYYASMEVPDIIKFFAHLENVYLEILTFYESVDEISKHDEVMQIKEKLLQNPNLKQFKIHANKKMLESDFEEINASLQQYNTSNAPYPCWITIPYPDSDKKLEMLVDKELIWFKGPCYVGREWEEESCDEDDVEENEDEDELEDALENIVQQLQFLELD